MDNNQTDRQTGFIWNHLMCNFNCCGRMESVFFIFGYSSPSSLHPLLMGLGFTPVLCTVWKHTLLFTHSCACLVDTNAFAVECLLHDNFLSRYTTYTNCILAIKYPIFFPHRSPLSWRPLGVLPYADVEPLLLSTRLSASMLQDMQQFYSSSVRNELYINPHHVHPIPHHRSSAHETHVSVHLHHPLPWSCSHCHSRCHH